MNSINAENERIKRVYFRFLRNAKGHSQTSIDIAAKAIARFDGYNRWKSYKAFNIDQAIAFKRHLANQIGARTGEKLSRATLRQTLGALKAFFEWLSDRQGYRSRIAYSDAEYFSLSLKDDAIARAVSEKRFPTLDQMHHVLACMPVQTEVQRRDRALVACAVLTGARADALASLRIKHVDLRAGVLYQDAKQVRTKFSTSTTVGFFPVGGEVRSILEQWINYLLREKLWCGDDPLFPQTETEPSAEHGFKVIGLKKECWKSSAPVRKIFKEAFSGAGLPYFNPHSLRDTLGQLGERLCQSPEALKAWSQNLAHKGVLTTLLNYGNVRLERQHEIMRAFDKLHQAPD
jgi:integrase/recombinase XerD